MQDPVMSNSMVSETVLSDPVLSDSVMSNAVVSTTATHEPVVLDAFEPIQMVRPTRPARQLAPDPATEAEAEAEPTWPGFIDESAVHGVRIATLGPPGTSSEEAAGDLAQRLIRCGAASAAVDLYASFEDAVEATLLGLDDLAVIANAYGRINETYMRQDVGVVGVYLHQTPDYGLATRPGERVTGPQVIPSHPAPIPLLPHLDIGPITVAEIKRVSATSEAARLVATGEYAVALTNRRAVEEFGLTFVSSTCPIRMSWAVFAVRHLDPRVGRGHPGSVRQPTPRHPEPRPPRPSTEPPTGQHQPSPRQPSPRHQTEEVPA